MVMGFKPDRIDCINYKAISLIIIIINFSGSCLAENAMGPLFVGHKCYVLVYSQPIMTKSNQIKDPGYIFRIGLFVELQI